MTKKDNSTTDYRSFYIKKPLKSKAEMLNEHFFEHFLIKKKYTTGIYKAYNGRWSDLTIKQQNEALKKRWYVRWSYRNPETDKLERQRNIYGGVNHFKNHKDRMALLRHIEKNLIALLQSGTNPYEIDTSNEIPSTFEAIDNAMELKRLHMNKQSFIRFKSDINKFKRYLKSKGFERRFITSVKRSDVMNYLNEVLIDVSARSRNNYRASISALWQNMEDNQVIEKNFVKTIPMLKSKPKRNKTYSDDQVESLFSFMDKNCPNLLLFVKFVSYNFLRPIEVCRLTAGSFDLNSKTLNVFVKQGSFKTKTIPDILLKELPKLNGLDAKTSFFGKDELLTNWNAKEDRKRAYFTAEFAKVKKEFNLGAEFGIYSFRHYYISKLYRSLRKNYSPFETKSKMMLITGHSTMTALEKYLRSIDAELSEDYSNLIK